jgi:hypothetical protein
MAGATSIAFFATVPQTPVNLVQIAVWFALLHQL